MESSGEREREREILIMFLLVYSIFDFTVLLDLIEEGMRYFNFFTGFTYR